MKRAWRWITIRWKLHRTLMNGRTAVQFVKYLEHYNIDREVLKYIGARECTAARAEQCIVARPANPKDWCSRCLALDHVVREDEP
jgi:hypothetical protein